MQNASLISPIATYTNDAYIVRGEPSCGMGAQLDADVAIAGEVQVRMVAFSFSDILHTVEEIDRLLAIVPSRGVACTMFTCKSRRKSML
jgi:precorrin-3B methylase